MDPEAIEHRAEMCGLLASTSYIHPDEELFWHGRGYQGPTGCPPAVSWASDQPPRDDHEAPDWLTASEFCEQEPALEAKVTQLAQLLKGSNRTVVYSGAGISKAAGIGQAARGAGKDGGKSTDALPTFTHYALGALAKAGLIHGWVQQNHDGLPQKAGFPQENINEIHGSWYDPSNPVVKYSGTLKSEQYPWMLEDAAKAELVLVLGTSLGGLNADQVALRAAERSLEGRGLGMVMINLQQTEHDGKATLRLFEQSDRVMRMVLDRLGIGQIEQRPANFSQQARVLVPYDRQGKRSETARMWLDLRPGADVKLTPGHNIQGAKQPCYMHIGAPEGFRPLKGVVPGPGRGVVRHWCDQTVAIYLAIEGVRMTLGQWWLEAAIRGGPKTLPVVNLEPEMESE